MADYTTRIAEIDAILDRGLTRITDQDGRTHEYDFEQLRLQRDDLIRRQKGGLRTRVGIYNPRFSGL